MKISPARRAAFEILQKIENEKAFSSILLPVYEENLSPKDRALCHEITLGVLKNKIYLDFIVERLTNKSHAKLDSEVLNALRIGIYQMFFLDKIPAYSAINESVNLVKFARKKSASGLVNAVLRRASKEKNKFRLNAQGEFEKHFDFKSALEKFSVETSHPEWLLEKWSGQFGFETARKITRADNENPPAAFRPTRKFFAEEKGKKLEIEKFLNENFQKIEFLETGFAAESSADLRKLADENYVYFQDAGSQMIAQALEIAPGEKFLDVCAAPGSKTTLIASKSSGEIFAGDLYRHRVEFLKKNLRAQGCGETVRIVQFDAESSIPFADGSFDKILIDAPCTGTGTIRRNPEIRYFLDPSDFEILRRKQLRILRRASKLVRPGGEIIYSTCSLEPEENEQVVRAFLSENFDFEIFAPKIPEKFLTEDKFGRTFPHSDSLDGFFIAGLRRK